MNKGETFVLSCFVSENGRERPACMFVLAWPYAQFRWQKKISSDRKCELFFINFIKRLNDQKAIVFPSQIYL